MSYRIIKLGRAIHGRGRHGGVVQMHNDDVGVGASFTLDLPLVTL